MASGDNIDGITELESLEDPSNLKYAGDNRRIAEEDEEEEEKEKMPAQEKMQAQDKDRTSLDIETGQGMNSAGQRHTGTSIQRNKSERERKIGHRRVGVGGEITYKKIQTSQIMGSIQLGIQHAIGSLASKPERDLLMQDFMTVETTNFPSEGSNHTPAHHYSDFKFKTYAPIAFRYFRDLFVIQPDDFLISMCSARLRELSNPGASGSIFYLTDDDEFIIKTVQHKEGEFLQKLLPGYYMNLNQNPRTLLPKFFGLYCYQCNSKNIRLCAMNNLLPSSIRMHQKYDLKGSTYKRKASKSERIKKSPTYKDLDFMEHHTEGIFLEADTYSALIKTIQRDCRVLESFKIMDYSLLVGIHNLDQAAREKAERRSAIEQQKTGASGEGEGSDASSKLNRSRSINRQRLVAHSTAMESIQAESEPIDEEEDLPPGGIPARNAKGERLLLFLGIIDILQSYRLKKKLEHTWKSMIHDGDTVSVHRPGFYAQRFQDFMAKTVFKKIPSPLKHSPSKRKSISRVRQGTGMSESEGVDLQSSGRFKRGSRFSYTRQATLQSSKPGSPITTSPPPVSTSTPAVAVSSTVTSVAATSTIPSTTLARATVEPTTASSASAVGPSATAAVSSPPPTSQTVNYPAVLKDRPPSFTQKSKVPPPVPPRSPKRVHVPQGGGAAVTSSGAVPRGLMGTPSSSTPPPAFEDAMKGDFLDASSPKHRIGSGSSHVAHMIVTKSGRSEAYRDDRVETVSISDVRLESKPENKSSLSVESSSSTSGFSSTIRTMTWTPPASVEGSTPTWTEGTPSFTESSSSGDLGCPTTPVRSLSSSRDTEGPKSEEILTSQESEMVS